MCAAAGAPGWWGCAALIPPYELLRTCSQTESVCHDEKRRVKAPPCDDDVLIPGGNMLRWLLVCVLALVWGAEAAERTSVVSDEGFEIRIPEHAQRQQVSQVAPDLLENFAGLVNHDKVRILEMLLTRADIERAQNGSDPREISFRVLRHPLFGNETISEETWEHERPRYRKTIESSLMPAMKSTIQEKADDIYNDKVEESEEVRFKGFDRLGVYREDSTSLRYSTEVRIERGSGEEAVPVFIRAFSASVYLRGRVFMVQATRIVADTDAGADAPEDRAEFDRFVDGMIEMNP